MTQFLTALAGGTGQGAIYVLLAVGFVIIYKSMQLISFAQPALMMAGAVLVSYLTPRLGFVGGTLAGIIIIAVAALIVERLTIRPMVGKAVFVIAIVTIGIDIVIRVVAGAFIGTDPRFVGDPWGLDVTMFGDISVQHRHIAAVVTAAVVVAALAAFFKYAPMGVAMRAASLDQEAAMTQGVSVGSVFALSWALAGGLAALAGVFASAGNPIDQNLWVIGLTALPVIILGGLDSIGGAVIGGLVVGIVEALVRSYHTDLFPYFETNAGPLAPYVLMLVVLLVRPHGLFGTREVERV